MTNGPLVSIIVPNWNGKSVLRMCLESLTHLDYSNFEIIVVDNASKDGSPNIVKKEFPHVGLIINERNLGFAGGCNVGIRAAKGELICLFNNDAVATPSWLSELVQAILSPGVGIVGGIIYYCRPEKVIWSAGMRLDAVTGIDWRVAHGYRLDDLNETDDIDYLSGCALLIKREVMEKVGVLDEKYFFYCEDLDLNLRAQRAGYECRLVPTASACHMASFTRKKVPLQGYYHQMRGLFRIYFKHFPFRYLATCLFFQLVIFPFFEMTFFRTSPLFTIQRLNAFGWNVARLKETIADRYRVNSIGKVTLRNRFKEFVEVSRSHLASRYYDF